MLIFICFSWHMHPAFFPTGAQAAQHLVFSGERVAVQCSTGHSQPTSHSVPQPASGERRRERGGVSTCPWRVVASSEEGAVQGVSSLAMRWDRRDEGETRGAMLHKRPSVPSSIRCVPPVLLPSHTACPPLASYASSSPIIPPVPIIPPSLELFPLSRSHLLSIPELPLSLRPADTDNPKGCLIRSLQLQPGRGEEREKVKTVNDRVCVI